MQPFNPGCVSPGKLSLSLCVPQTSLTQWQHIARLDSFPSLAGIHTHGKHIQKIAHLPRQQATQLSCQCITSNDWEVFTTITRIVQRPQQSKMENKQMSGKHN